MDLVDEFGSHEFFSYYHEYLSHRKLVSTKYAYLLAGGNFTKTSGESGSCNEVICVLYGFQKSTSTHVTIQSNPFEGEIQDLENYLKDNCNTEPDERYTYFTRKNYTTDDYAILHISLEPLNLVDLQKDIVISFLRCKEPKQIVVAATGLGKSYAAIGVLLQLVSMKQNDEHCFYFTTDSRESVDQIIADFRQFCPGWDINKYKDGKFISVQSKRKNTVAIYISTHSALLRKFDENDKLFNDIAKRSEIIIVDEMESPIDAPVMMQIINPFSRCFGITGTLVSRNTTGYQVDLVATAEDCVKVGRTLPTKSFILHKNSAYDPLVDLISRISGKFMLFTNNSDEYNHVFHQLSEMDDCSVMKASSHEGEISNENALSRFRSSKSKTTIIVLIQKFVRGISVSDMAGVIDLSIGVSTSNKAQKAGRAIRLHEGKNFASYYHIVDTSITTRRTVFMHSSQIQPFVFCESYTEVFIDDETSASRVKPDGLIELKYAQFLKALK
jgi:superfamily II DNA or RNA helicase